MAAIFDYPPHTHFGKIVAKSKIYDRARPSKKLQDLFVAQISRITWQHKLAPETLNLATKKDLREIQVFEIALKTDKLDPSILRCIDKAVAYPVIFHLTYGGKIMAAAAYKRKSGADSAKWVTGETYFETPWQDETTPRQKLPVALDMKALYTHILRAMLPLRPQQDETLDEQITRTAQVAALEKEAARLEKHLRTEKQFNRKVEINAAIRDIREEIAALVAKN